MAESLEGQGAEPRSQQQFLTMLNGDLDACPTSSEHVEHEQAERNHQQRMNETAANMADKAN